MPEARPLYTALAFDYGTRSIGVAVGQSLTGSATPLAPLKARDGVPRWEEIAALLKEWQPRQVVVGHPLNMDGTESELSQQASRFARRLAGRFNLPVAQIDERLSSFEARGELLAQGRRDFRAAGVDGLSAALILQSYWRQQGIAID